MDVNLPTDLAEFVDEQVRDGRYQQASDVVSAALRQFQLRGGTGSSAAAAAYQEVPLPFPDPNSPTGVRFCPTNLYNGSLDDVAQLRAISDGLRGRLDSMSDLSTMTSLKPQMAMDRRSKLMETLSNIMKANSDTQHSPCRLRDRVAAVYSSDRHCLLHLGLPCK